MAWLEFGLGEGFNVLMCSSFVWAFFHARHLPPRRQRKFVVFLMLHSAVTRGKFCWQLASCENYWKTTIIYGWNTTCHSQHLVKTFYCACPRILCLELRQHLKPKKESDLMRSSSWLIDTQLNLQRTFLQIIWGWLWIAFGVLTRWDLQHENASWDRPHGHLAGKRLIALSEVCSSVAMEYAQDADGEKV